MISAKPCLPVANVTWWPGALRAAFFAQAVNFCLVASWCGEHLQHVCLCVCVRQCSVLAALLHENIAPRVCKETAHTVGKQAVLLKHYRFCTSVRSFQKEQHAKLWDASISSCTSAIRRRAGAVDSALAMFVMKVLLLSAVCRHADIAGVAASKSPPRWLAWRRKGRRYPALAHRW